MCVGHNSIDCFSKNFPRRQRDLRKLNNSKAHKDLGFCFRFQNQIKGIKIKSWRSAILLRFILLRFQLKSSNKYFSDLLQQGCSQYPLFSSNSCFEIQSRLCFCVFNSNFMNFVLGIARFEFLSLDFCSNLKIYL